MTYPASVVSRAVQIGGAVSVEQGHPLTVHTVTVASRALIHMGSGTRLEKVAFESTSPLTGEAVWWEIAATDQSNTYLDAETRQAIVLGTDEHTHLYTTTLTILDGTEQIAEYVIGPYPVPSGASVLDLDTSLIPSGTAEGTLIAIPASWEQTIADATAIVEVKRQEIIDLIRPVAAGIIKSDPTVAAAAAAGAAVAVDEALATAEVVRFIDEGIPSAKSIPGYTKLSVGPGADGFDRMAEDALDDQGRIPSWVLERVFARAGALGLIETNSGPIRLLIVAGQSNATPRGATTQIGMGFTEPGVLYWDHAAGMIRDTHAVEWLGTGFARQWVKDHPGERVLIVNAASGSTGFRTTSLNPAPSGYVTATGTWNRNFTADTGQVDPHTFPDEYLITRVADAAAAALAATGEEPEKLAMLWGQGESDINNSASYAAWQDDLFTWVRGQWGTPDLPIIVASMTPARISDTTLPNYASLDRVQQDTVSRLARTAYSRGPSFFEENTALRTHYLPLGQEKRGREIAERGIIRALQNKAAADPLVALHPPQALTASRVGTRVRFTWEHAACRATSITGEFSTDNGGTWTPITFPNLMPVEWETTTASPVLLRLASVNGADVSYNAEIGV